MHLEVAGPDRDRQTYDPLGAFETILEHSPLKVIIFDRDSVIREVSRPAAELARMPREAMRGQTLRSEVRALLQKRSCEMSRIAMSIGVRLSPRHKRVEAEATDRARVAKRRPRASS